jgi:hypothetical protein
MEGEDVGLPGPDGAGKPGQLRHPDAVCPAVEALQRGSGVGQVVGGVDGSEQFLALPGGRHLATRVTGGKPSAQPRSSPAGELLGGRQQQLADPVQRVMLAAPVAQGGLLHAMADLVDHRVGQLDGVEVVHDHGGVAERGCQRAGVAAPGVQRDRADLG